MWLCLLLLFFCGRKQHVVENKTIARRVWIKIEIGGCSSPPGRAFRNTSLKKVYSGPCASQQRKPVFKNMLPFIPCATLTLRIYLKMDSVNNSFDRHFNSLLWVGWLFCLLWCRAGIERQANVPMFAKHRICPAALCITVCSFALVRI